MNTIPEIDRHIPEGLQTATFALGWFWGPDSRFGSLDGVIRTRVGYTGDEKLDPTYHDLGEHTESLQLDFDPSVITYTDLLEHFWSAHSPTSPAYSAQYKAAVFYHSEEQLSQAQASLDRLADTEGRVIQTELLPASRFYRAEDYHQKYCLRRNTELTQKLEAIYPDPKDFTDSTAAARLNGQLAGFGALSVDLV